MPLRFLLVFAIGFLLPLGAKPALYLIGDSTVRNSTHGQRGWGDPLVDHFDSSSITVVNRAIGGRSSRTFLTEGRWDAVMAHLKTGDFVIMQFGHNDGGPINADRARASLKGNGDQTETIIRQSDGKEEIVSTYGAYLQRYVNDAKAKGATPIVLSPIPRNIWQNGKVTRAASDYGLWAKEAAEQAGARFIDFNAILAERYEELGQEKTSALFTEADHTHTGSEGAAFNAAVLAEAIRELKVCDLGTHLLPADLWLPSIFSNHMVVQRDMPLPIWGRARAGTEVTVTLAAHSTTTTANRKGDWKLEFPPMTAGGPHTLQVSADGKSLSYTDVLSGEVWLCAGQSNMDFTLAATEKRYFAGSTDWQNEVAAANHPRIRSFSAEWAMHEFPQRDVEGQWQLCTPETAGDFSAVAYYFGLELHKALDVPIGLITCAYGASTIESWIREETLVAHPQFDRLLKEFSKKRLEFRDNPSMMEDYGKAITAWEATRDKRKAAGQSVPRAPKHPDPVQDQHNPFVLHNGMIAPIVPYALRGTIWYQGESNLNTRNLYADLQKALIEDWRDLWNNESLPFYYVQLAPHKAPPSDPGNGSSLAEMREAQSMALALPHTGMAVTLDIGDEKDVHPRNKADVGKRLSRLALAKTYGHPVVANGPIFKSAVTEGARLICHFEEPPDLVAREGELRQFAIAGADRKFVWAKAVIEGDQISVSSPAVPQPMFVRYAWSDNPEGANLFNGSGLPAAPFRNHP